MKIYFSGSISGGRQDVQLYHKMIKLLSNHGQVLTEHVGDINLIDSEASFGQTPEEIFEQDITWLKQADAVVAEVTQPSLGVGYELGIAEKLKLPVLCLYRENSGKKLSAMISGNSKFETYYYKNLDDVAKIFLDYFLE